MAGNPVAAPAKHRCLRAGPVYAADPAPDPAGMGGERVSLKTGRPSPSPPATPIRRPTSCDQHGDQLRHQNRGLTLHYRDDGSPFNAGNLSIRLI